MSRKYETRSVNLKYKVSHNLTEHNNVPKIQLAYTIAAEQSRAEHTLSITNEINHEFGNKTTNDQNQVSLNLNGGQGRKDTASA